MNDEMLFPGYVPRDEERKILEEAARVRETRKSRAMLLYGPGGVGKTSLVRQLARANSDDPMTVWIDPVDIDDSTYWLLSNLEQHVALQLDPANQYFGPYFEYLSRLPSFTRPGVGYETVVSHFGRIKEIFAECYQNLVEDSGQMVVIVLDTVEVVRGLYLLVTLTQWMKDLPATLFILSGRPLPSHYPGEDPIKAELEDPYKSLPITAVHLGEFTLDAAIAYLNSSGVASGLSDEEKTKLVHLTRGHPLWLAFTIDYLKNTGLPQEIDYLKIGAITGDEDTAPRAGTEHDLPYRGEMTPRGQSLHEAFKRRLVTPYQETDFWHEAIKRLAVVRESINQEAWQRLMDDRPLPAGVADLAQAWAKLLQTPWIRPRANRRYVTLHDAVAEELAQRIIQLHDQDKQWRVQLWKRAAGIYDELTAARDAELAGKLTGLDQTLHELSSGAEPGNGHPPPGEQETDFVEKASLLVAEKRELSQLKTVRLHYGLLSDFEGGGHQFLELMEQAKFEHDLLFQDLLAFEAQRFLPGAADSYAFGDAIGEVIGEFRGWLGAGGRDLHLSIGLSMADYLIKSERPDTALSLLESLPEATADPGQRYRLCNLRGNACMRIPGRVRDGLGHFKEALQVASSLQTPDQLKLIAKAHKELGFYYRNAGLWHEADTAYQDARDAISATLSVGSTEDDREEMASIQTNWAYVKGLGGHYRDGTNLVESAIAVRHRLKKYQQEGNSWSVCGEVYRYGRRFQKAWDAYAQAEQIFQGLRNWAWLGLIYQEQAICLFQAAQDGINLTPDEDPTVVAKERITRALDLCRDLSIRSYPSALNRAGRIFGSEDCDAGLRYLDQGIRAAHTLWDGWFWFANLIEYVELCYRAWLQTGDNAYRDQIAGRAAEINEVMQQYAFPDLKGRWRLVQGHLDVHYSLMSGDESRLSSALEHYKKGFSLIAQEYVGSSGAAAIAEEFKSFRELVWKLPDEIRALWQEEFRRAWSDQTAGSTLLLARLEELY